MILELQAKVEMLEMQKVEMRSAFEKVQQGKEKQLKDAHLIFFAKRKTLVENYNNQIMKLETYKLDVEKELKVKDQIIEAWKKNYDRACQEIKLSKLILSDQNLAYLAFKDFKDSVADINDENLLKEGCVIHELLSDYWMKQKCFSLL